MFYRAVSFIPCFSLIIGSLLCPSLQAAEKKPTEQFTIVTFGDSTTATRGPLNVYSKILAKELPQLGFPVKVINSGIGGNNTEQAKARFEKDVLRHRPDLVVIQFGINDSAIDVWKNPPETRSRVSNEKYEANLRSMIRTLKKKNISVILMTPNSMRWNVKTKQLYNKPPYDAKNPDGFNVTLKKYLPTVQKIAREETVPLVDVYAAFENYAKQPGQSADDLLSDGMHPNTKGQKMVADLLIPQIKAILEKKKP
ncbi:MAG: hypothetical protein K0U86_12910 [Planctomycetes bacterium]|nr:hypothetical protein [Planctomycetota bacterium]MCH9725789.1 hypothetical protein [Planctomycetota bacterium]MCH9777844.1 hypothetical protein [Planctomycetota bacterium]MCH9791013.1 hypothetical protein [Planctomycetota bacterium]